LQGMQSDGAHEISPDVIDMIVERVTARLAEFLMAHFDTKHDVLATRMSALESLIHASSSDIKDDTKFTRVLARQSFAEFSRRRRPGKTNRRPWTSSTRPPTTRAQVTNGSTSTASERSLFSAPGRTPTTRGTR
jgi:hypothetical protein